MSHVHYLDYFQREHPESKSEYITLTIVFQYFNIGHLKLVVLLAHILIFKYTTST